MPCRSAVIVSLWVVFMTPPATLLCSPRAGASLERHADSEHDPRATVAVERVRHTELHGSDRAAPRQPDPDRLAEGAARAPFEIHHPAGVEEDRAGQPDARRDGKLQLAARRRLEVAAERDPVTRRAERSRRPP